MLILSSLLCVLSCSVISNSLQSHGLLHTRHHCPWGFSRPEYWSQLPCPAPGVLPNLRVEPRSPALQVDSLPSEPPGKSHFSVNFPKFFNHSRSVLWLFLPVLTITQIYGCNILAAPSRLITHLKEKSSPQDIVPYHQKLSIQTLYLMHLPTSINQSIYQ